VGRLSTSSASRGRPDPAGIDNWPEDPAKTARTALGRYGRLSEVANAAAFLAGEESSYLTGQNIRVDGGLARFY
jgi:NAD(P)-dependent dehydrogenase (short-subunit alcohol dehydrogenase family)